jgi:hypothetical protein
MRWALGLPLLVLLAGPVRAADDFWSGDLRPVSATALFAQPGPPGGSFLLYASEPGRDVYDAPGVLYLATDDGLLIAAADDPPLRFTPNRRDTLSFRTIRADAPADATCPTGAEPDCWQPGDPELVDRSVADAMESAMDRPGAMPDLPPLFELVQPPLDAPIVWDGAVFGSVRYPGTVGMRGPSDPLDWGTGLFVPPVVRPPHDFRGAAGLPFRDEMAALSWNFLMTLVAFSSVSDPGPRPTDVTAFDPNDPDRIAPGQCSFLQPQYCSSVIAFFDPDRDPMLSRPFDPALGGTGYTWEHAVAYRVYTATGSFALYTDGTVHVMAAERARGGVASRAVPLVLFPGTNVALVAGDPFAVARDDGTIAPAGFAYATVPEPSTLAAAIAATLALAARRRRST